MRKKEETSRTDTAHAHPEEMVFVLLSRDVAAPATIRAWCDERIRLGKNKPTDDQIVEALACAATMEAERRKWVGVADPTRREAATVLDALEELLDGDPTNSAEHVLLIEEYVQAAIREAK
jgi:hypothetical protein